MEDFYLIVGSRGFIGSNVYETFNKKYDNVIKISLSDSSLEKFFLINQKKHLGNKFIIIFCSSLRPLEINNRVKMIENLNLLLNFLKKLEKKYIKKFIFLSTVDVYKYYKKKLINEESKLAPKNYYSKSKLLSERFLTDFFINKNSLVILRLPGVSGKKDSFNSTVGLMIYKAQTKKYILLNNFGLELRDYVYIKDLIKFLKLLINSKFNGILNFVTGDQTKIIDIANIISQNFKSDIINIKNNRKNLVNIRFNNYKLKKNFSNFKFTVIENAIKEYCKSL